MFRRKNNTPSQKSTNEAKIASTTRQEPVSISAFPSPSFSSELFNLKSWAHAPLARSESHDAGEKPLYSTTIIGQHDAADTASLTSTSLPPSVAHTVTSIDSSEASLARREYNDDAVQHDKAFLRRDGRTSFRSSKASSSSSWKTSFVAPAERKRNSLDEFTISTLRFDRVGLYGRDKEQQILLGAFEKVKSGQKDDTTAKKQCLAVSGYSGTGKTALVETTLADPVKKAGGLWVHGKFDLHLRNVPYSGLASACGSVCAQLLAFRQSRGEEWFAASRDTIRNELGAELTLLIRVIPILEEIFDDGEERHDALQTSSSPLDSKHRLQYAFTRFVRVVSETFPLLALVIDDVQWADSPSLDLLESLITDRSLRKLFVIMIYRSNEVDETHLLSKLLRDLRPRASSDCFVLEELETVNLEFPAVHQCVQDILSTDNEDRTRGLAQLCNERTHGNAFFLLFFFVHVARGKPVILQFWHLPMDLERR